MKKIFALAVMLLALSTGNAEAKYVPPIVLGPASAANASIWPFIGAVSFGVVATILIANNIDPWPQSWIKEYSYPHPAGFRG